MKSLSFISFLFLSALSVIAQDVVTLPKRMVTLDRARQLLTTKSSTESAEELEQKNPFISRSTVPKGDSVIEQPKADVISNQEKLSALAVQVRPTGTAQVGNVQFLLIGQKRLKVGDFLPIVFQGTTYDVKISAIEKTTFTLRLNEEELVRPINPAANKP